MEKEGIQASHDESKQEKFARNQCKLDQHREAFTVLTNEVNVLLEKTEYKVDRVMIDLTLKFTKQMQLSYFKDMNQTFMKLQEIEGEMTTIDFHE